MYDKEKLAAAILAAMALKGTKPVDLSRHFGIARSSVTGWTKKGRIKKDKLGQLMEYFSDVVGPEHWGATQLEYQAYTGSKRSPGQAQDQSTINEITIPVFTTTEVDMLLQYARTPIISENYHQVGGGYEKRKLYAYRLEDDSMSDASHPHSMAAGAKLIVDPQIQAAPGHYVIVRMPDGNAYCRQLVIDAGVRMLRPINRQYTSREAPHDNDAYLGVVIEVHPPSFSTLT